jgi:hypothetical protein
MPSIYGLSRLPSPVLGNHVNELILTKQNEMFVLSGADARARPQRRVSFPIPMELEPMTFQGCKRPRGGSAQKPSSLGERQQAFQTSQKPFREERSRLLRSNKSSRRIRRALSGMARPQQPRTAETEADFRVSMRNPDSIGQDA